VVLVPVAPVRLQPSLWNGPDEDASRGDAKVIRRRVSLLLPLVGSLDLQMIRVYQTLGRERIRVH